VVTSQFVPLGQCLTTAKCEHAPLRNDVITTAFVTPEGKRSRNPDANPGHSLVPGYEHFQTWDDGGWEHRIYFEDLGQMSFGVERQEKEAMFHKALYFYALCRGFIHQRL